MTEVLKVGAHFLLDQGGLHWVRFANRRHLRILCYHRFSSPAVSWADEFERQCAHLRRHFYPISLTEAARLANLGLPWPDGAVALTIDDGYRDVATVAAPILERYRIPATVYLIGDFLDQGAWNWWDILHYSLLQTSHAQYETQCQTWPLSDIASRLTALGGIAEMFKGLADRERMDRVARFPAALGVVLPAVRPAYYLPLSWTDVARLSRQGIEFGAHTLRHPILPRVESDDDVRHQIIGSKQLIEERTGLPVRHFCYPNGDFDSRAEAAVAESGFETSVTCQDGLLRQGSDPLHWARLGMAPNPDVPQGYFERTVAGFRRMVIP